MALRNLLIPDAHIQTANVGLLLLRVWTGMSLLALHGWNKLVNFGAVSEQFSDVLGIGSPAANLALVVLAEVVAATLVALGLLTRLAAVVVAIDLTVAFFAAHGGRLSGPGNGELAFIFLAGFVTLLIAGPGRYSLDALLFGPRRADARKASGHAAS